MPMSQVDQAAQDQSAKKLISMPLTTELWREYEWIEPVNGAIRVYRIEKPVSVHFYRGCTTHRVVDSNGVAHSVPAIGFYGCVLRWQTADASKPVNF